MLKTLHDPYGKLTVVLPVMDELTYEVIHQQAQNRIMLKGSTTFIYKTVTLHIGCISKQYFKCYKL